MASDFQIPAPLIILARRRQNSPLTPFLEKDGDPLMYRNVAAIARNTNAYGNALLQLNDRVSRCERRAAIQDDPTVNPLVYAPFQIYNIPANGVSVTTPGAGYANGDVLTIAGGTVAPGGQPTQITVILVDASGHALSAYASKVGSYSESPPSPAAVTGGSGSGAMVTVLSSSDSWRTFQIEPGDIAARSTWNPYAPIPPYPLLGNIQFGSESGVPVGNSEFIFGDIGTGTSWSFSAPIFTAGVGTIPNNLTDANPFLIYGYLADGTKVGYSQIVLDGTTTMEAPGQLAVWMEIVDDKTKGFYINIWGMMQNYAAVPPKPFPPGQNMIPIGYVTAMALGGGIISPPIIQQILYGDLVNRWPAMDCSAGVTSGNAYGGVGCFRGYYSADNLDGQMFYPGDWVIDDRLVVFTVTKGGGGTVNFYRQFIWIVPGAGFTASTGEPLNVGNSNWAQIGDVPTA